MFILIISYCALTEWDNITICFQSEYEFRDTDEYYLFIFLASLKVSMCVALRLRKLLVIFRSLSENKNAYLNRMVYINKQIHIVERITTINSS